MRLKRVEPDANMKRFYRMEIVQGLFGDWGLIREWGRIGRSGTMRTDWFVSQDEADKAKAKLQRQKARRGYIQYGT